jgi:hypothetical protein
MGSAFSTETVDDRVIGMTERAFLNNLLRSGDVFVDVGANIGLFTDNAATTAGSSCHDLYRLLEGFGYRMFVYDAGARY